MITQNNSILRITEIQHFQWNAGTFSVKARDYSVLAFRIRGNAIIESEDGIHEIKSGDILYLPQGMDYHAKYSDTDLIAIHFTTRRRDNKIEVRTPRDPERFKGLFWEARKLWKEKEPGYATFAMAELFTILGILEEESVKSNLPKSFLSAVSYIHSNFTDPDLSVDRICAKSDLSATSFRLLFRRHCRKTPTEYITSLRLEYAKKLISGGMTVEEAAYESGFSDPKYFARVVKKYFGCTPKSFKAYGK